MPTYGVLLSGEHPTLPEAELRALLDVHAPWARMEGAGTMRAVTGPAPVEDALGRMALCHGWGRLWARLPDDDGLPEAAAQVVAQRCDGAGTLGVATQRRGDPKSARSQDCARAMGAAARARGHSIDLADPQWRLFAWFDAGEAWIGVEGGRNAARRTAYEARTIERRAHFSPVGLHPRRAASLVHLARVPPGGTVYDPCCGTGGIVLEAALDGYRCIASDLDPRMVQGTYQTLTDAAQEPLDAEAFVADVGATPALVGPVDGIVTDLPYGRASTTDGEALDALYARALASVVELLRPGAYAVLGTAEPDLLALPAGLVEVERHAEYVHRSLTRHFVIVKRTGQVGGA